MSVCVRVYEYACVRVCLVCVQHISGVCGVIGTVDVALAGV